jgi:YggT family protein
VILINELINLYIYVLFISAILSWFPAADPNGFLGQIKRVVSQLTEPVLRPLRQMIPKPAVGGVRIDLSVWIAIVILTIVQRII